MFFSLLAASNQLPLSPRIMDTSSGQKVLLSPIMGANDTLMYRVTPITIEHTSPTTTQAPASFEDYEFNLWRQNESTN
jgi:hypothetical protein